MASLIENVLSIENQANEVIAKAQAESKSIEKSAQVEIERVRQEIEQQVDERIEAYRRDATSKHEAALADEKKEAASRLAALDRLESGTASKLADLVVTKFREH